MAPVLSCPGFCIGLESQVGVNLGSHHVGIATLQHRPVDKALVLSRHRATSPFAVVGGESGSGIDIDRIKSEQAAVELCGPLAVGITAQHVAEEFIVAEDTIQIGICGFGLDPASLPEVMPPFGATVFAENHGDRHPDLRYASIIEPVPLILVAIG